MYKLIFFWNWWFNVFAATGNSFTKAGYSLLYRFIAILLTIKDIK